MKRVMVNYSKTLQNLYIRFLLTKTPINGFGFCRSDVEQAYLKSEKLLGRAVYISNAPAKFYIGKDECLELLQLLYGLFE